MKPDIVNVLKRISQLTKVTGVQKVKKKMNRTKKELLKDIKVLQKAEVDMVNNMFILKDSHKAEKKYLRKAAFKYKSWMCVFGLLWVITLIGWAL